MADTSSASSEFECDYSSGEEAYNYNIDVPFYRGVERKILPADVVPLVLRCVSSAQVSPAAAGDAFAARLARAGAPGRRGRRPRRRGRRVAPRGPADRGARARGRAGTRYRAHRKTRGLRARRFCSGSGVAPEPGVLAIDRARSIHEWGRRWRATALERRKCAKPRTCYRISYY